MIQLLFVLLGIAGERLGCVSAPDQRLGLTIEDIDDQGAYWDIFHRRRGKRVPPEGAPKPSATQAIVRTC